MAAVLLATTPSGCDAIVRCRADLVCALPCPPVIELKSRSPPTLRHICTPLHSYSSSRLYIGFGSTDCQDRPSAWANPFHFIEGDRKQSCMDYRDYLSRRADLPEYLSHLEDKQLICDCPGDQFCHGHELISKFVSIFHDSDDDEDDKYDAFCSECVLEDFEEDDDSVDTDGLAAGPRFIPSIEQVNETVRSGAVRLQDERPMWLDSWVRIIWVIRSASIPVFWEMFSGKAGLTREFLRQGWPCGPPVDIVFNPELDLLNPLFFAVVLGLIYERRVRLLHLGPPCSSFSMACNRFPQYAMRSASEPGGFANLPPHRAEKVRLGNALAEVSVRLAEAQEKALNFWTFEQPATSLMWLFTAVLLLMQKATSFAVLIDVCMFGAPWRKPTTIAANFASILRLRRKCNGQHHHISLQGNSPDGRSWTAVASPYWPQLSEAWVEVSACLYVESDVDFLAPLHFAGFAGMPAELPVDVILEDMDFRAPRGGTNSNTALTVATGVQPTGRKMPQLLPDGLGPKDHLFVAQCTLHPLARPPSIPAYCRSAIDFQKNGHQAVNKARMCVMRLLRELASSCAHSNKLIQRAVHPWISRVVEQRNIAFMREVRYVCCIGDFNIMLDYIFGLPMMGWARHSPLLCQKTTAPPRADKPSREQISDNNAVVMAKAKASTIPEQDLLSWEKTDAEFQAGTMLGPYYAIGHLPGTDPRLLNRFSILERHGGAVQASCRNIDDCKAPGHNEDSANTAAHRPADLDMFGAVIRAEGEAFPDEAMAGFPSDFKGAYRQVPACPKQALDFTVATWDPLKACTVFGIAVSQLFGSGNAPLNFTRYPDFCCRALGVLLAIACIHCVDDMLVVEILKTIMSAYSSWREFAVLCGWDVPDAKSPPPSQVFRALGAMIDLSAFPWGPLRFCPADDRVKSLCMQLEEIRSTGKLSPALAGKLYGKLMFLSSQYFGRLGRALLRSFSRRQHEAKRTNLNPQILAAIKFWLSNMKTLKPREIPISLSDRPVYISYSDGEGESAGVGVSLWRPGKRAIAGYIQLPMEVRGVWSRAATAGDHYDIYEIEAVGPALVLHNFGELIESESLWIHYIDNDSALATLVKGSSSVLSGEMITAYTHSKIADLNLWGWFERVSSGDNPVDKLSRGSSEGDWDIVPIEFPPQLLGDLRSYLA